MPIPKIILLICKPDQILEPWEVQGVGKRVEAGDVVDRPGRELLLTSSTLSFSLSLATACRKIRNMFSTSLNTQIPSLLSREIISKIFAQVTVIDVF